MSPTPDDRPLIVKQSGQTTVTTTVPAWLWRCTECGWLGTGWTSEGGATKEGADHLWDDHGIAYCHPDEQGEHRWERIAGSDGASRCKRCGRVSAK